MNVGIVVEGECDYLFFDSQRHWFASKNYKLIKIIPVGGRRALVKDAMKHLKMLRLLECEKVIFFIDQDLDPCPPTTASRLDAVRTASDVLVCVMGRELEGWFLADSDMIKIVTGKTYNAHTDDVCDAKEALKRLIKKEENEIISATSVVNKVKGKFSFERAGLRNRTITRFLSKL